MPPKRPGRKPIPTRLPFGKKKPGPTAIAPSNQERGRVELGIAGGFSVAALARLFDMPRTTFARVFKDEIEMGRTKCALQMAECLFEQAKAGNVAAAKAVLLWIERRTAKEAPEAAPNKWAGLAERVHGAEAPNLVDFQICKLDS